jgi:3-oxoacyl-[acyl-carrier protein] reductase
MTEPLLVGKVAVVTGAAQGIGHEIARALHRHGARVVLADLDGTAVIEAASDIDGVDSECTGTACDVTSEERMHALVTDTLRGHGRLDIFVNNAIQPGLTRTPMTAAMPPQVLAEREAAIPMKRAGEPAEVTGAVVFLGSELSSYITGTVLEVGGGRFI